MRLTRWIIPFILAAHSYAQEDPEIVESLRSALPDSNIKVLESPTSLHSAIVICHALDEAGEIVGGTTGLAISKDLVLVSLEQLLNAHTITVQPHCCDKQPAEGIVAFDIRTGLAYLSVPNLEAKPYEDGFEDMPEDLPATLQGVHGLPFRIEGFEGVVTMSAEVIKDWRRKEYPRTVIINNSFRRLGAGGLTLGSSGKPFGMVASGAGGGHMGVVPISAHTKLTRLEHPIRGIDVLDAAPDDAAKAMVLASQAGTLRRSDPRSAADAAREAIALDENNAEAHYHLGVCLDLMGQRDEAIESLTRSVELDPEWSESWYSLGLVHLTGNNYPEAATSFERARQNDPFYGDIHAMLGIAYLRDSRPNAAFESMNAACELEPDNLQYLNNLTLSLDQYDRQAEIPPAWRRYVEFEPDDAERWQTAIIQTMRARQYEAFQTMASDAEERLGQPDALLGAIALRTLMEGDEEHAEALANQALTKDPDDFLALSVQYSLEARREQGDPPPP